MAREVIVQRLLVLSLIAAVLALAPAAHASPPDQSWIPGLYDDADFDDVILLITSNLSAIHPSVGCSLRPAASVDGLVTPMNTEPRSLCAQSSALSRAPPMTVARMV